ncbi:MAG: T9SS type A sorting domain-containing protein [bacterium]
MLIKTREIIFLAITIVCILGFPSGVKSQLSGLIENPEIYNDTLDFGICIVGDTISKTFLIKNTGSKTLKLGPTRPSFSIEETGGLAHQDDHEEFRDTILIFPKEIYIQPDSSARIKVLYDATIDTNSYPIGEKFARLTIGLYDFELSKPPDSLKDCVASINIILSVRKVRHFVDGYCNSYNFDSVYVNPASPIDFKWKVANASSKYLQIDTQRVVWRTVPLSPPEFNIENKQLPIPLLPKDKPIDWNISYYPVNRGQDKTVLYIGAKVNEYQDFTYLDISGTGVEQDLVVLASNASGYKKDTIDIGRVWVGQSKEIWALFGNNGNMNFGAGKQYIFDGFEGDFPSETFSITKPIPDDRHFFISQGDTFKLKFSAGRKGPFVARYIIESDISQRKIRGVPESALKEIFYLKGEGIEPQLVPEHDTIDFGNVVWHPDCSTSRTFTLKLRNTGNTELQIINILYKPPFSIEYFRTEPLSYLSPLALDSINIIFTPNIQESYLSELIFITNGNPPQDSIKVILKATKSDPDYVRLSISKDFRVKPGNLISIPLEVNSKLVTKARTFQTELTYNKTILKYLSYEKIGTAAEIADIIEITEFNGGGRLKIYIETPTNGTFFMSQDTLIKLNFGTYIGDNLSTSLAYIEPLFGDGICNKVLLPLDTNGLVTIDSICGLQQLLLPQGYGNFLIGEIAPNPVSNFAMVHYELKYEIPIEITIYNELGIPVKNYFNGIQSSGIYYKEIPTGDFPTGIYYLQFKSGIFSTNRRLIIIR